MQANYSADTTYMKIIDIQAEQVHRKIIPKTLHACFMYKFLCIKSAIQAAIE